MAEEPKIDWKALEAITKKVLAYKPKRKASTSEKREARIGGNHGTGQP